MALPDFDMWGLIVAQVGMDRSFSGVDAVFGGDLPTCGLVYDQYRQFFWQSSISENSLIRFLATQA